MAFRSVRAAALLLSAALVAGCGGAAAPAAPSSPAPAPAAQAPAPSAAPQSLKKVTLRLPWLVGGYDDGFILAKAKGYYKDAGFDVDIQEGKGSAVTAQTVGNGSDLFGLADAGTSAQLISKGDPIKVLGVYVQKSPMSFTYDKNHPFSTPKDLIGRTVISSAGDADLQMLPAVLAKAGMKQSDLKINLVQPSSYASELKTHPEAVILAFANSDYLRIHKEAPDALYKLYADFGVNVYNIGMITSTKEIQDHPDEVKRFMAATTKGWEYTLQHPDEAVAADHAMFPQADQKVESDGLKMTIDWLHTDNTKGHTIGWMSDKDWQQSLDLLHQYGGMATVKPLSDYYTNEFLPQS